MLKLTKGSTQKIIKITFFVVFCVNDEFTKPIVVFRSINPAYKLIEAIFKEYQYYKKVMKKHFNKNLMMSEEEKKTILID